MPEKMSGTNKIALALGSFAVLAVVIWAVYQTEHFSEQSELQIMGIIPQQPVQQAILGERSSSTAEIPQGKSTTEATAPQQNPPLQRLSLDESDSFLRGQLLAGKHSTALGLWLRADDLIHRSASYIDGLARGSLLGKIFPLNSPEGRFITHRSGDQIWLNAGNYERYSNTVNVLMSVDMQQIAQIFHRVRPLLESAFTELGYQPRQMDGLILQALDNILATPVIIEPLQLVRESVAYKFADSELEALLPLQKQLLRAGPENTRRLQRQALILQQALLNP